MSITVLNSNFDDSVIDLGVLEMFLTSDKVYNMYLDLEHEELLFNGIEEIPLDVLDNYNYRYFPQDNFYCVFVKGMINE